MILEKTNIQVALDFAKEAVEIAPCYYVTGNHEHRIDDYPYFEQKLKNIGVDVLRNESRILSSQKDHIVLLGVDDPSSNLYLSDEDTMKQTLSDLVSDDFMILLSHRPELFAVYEQHKIDLTLSGHVHGGQIRLPFIGAIYGPNQGLLPAYDGDHYKMNDSHLVVSRGIGNSLFPIRINNQPEIVLVELRNQ